MALNVQMILSENKLIGEKIVTPRIVNQQTLDYDAFCDYLAQGSTVTAADVSAVMKQLEKTLPVILALNAKVIASPEGLVFRPTVKGSITQSQLKAKLIQRKADYLASGDSVSAGKIDENRELVAGDLATSDLQACIVIDLPKKWDSRFQQTVTFKRVTKTAALAEDGSAGSESGDTDGDDTTSGGDQTPSKYTLTVVSNDESMGPVEGSGEYDNGETVNLLAEPKSGYKFVSWNDGNTSASRFVQVTESKTYTATFAEKP